MPTPAPDVHYVAVVEIKRVTSIPAHQKTSYPADGMNPAKREVVTIGRVNISNPELTKLVDKANLHLSLIEDGGDIDNGRVTRG